MSEAVEMISVAIADDQASVRRGLLASSLGYISLLQMPSALGDLLPSLVLTERKLRTVAPQSIAERTLRCEVILGKQRGKQAKA